MKKHEYAAAIIAMTTGDVTKEAHNHFETIHHALRFTEKMMREPSLPMFYAGYECINEALEAGTVASCSDVFKAMRDQALKELGE